MTDNDLKYWKEHLKDVVPENLITPEVVALRDQQNKMLNLMAKKNADYGNSFNKGCDSMGEAYGLCRMFDKANRFIKQAADKVSGYYNPNVTDESLYDTIQDLGNYCAMFMAWYNKDGGDGGDDNQQSTSTPSTGSLEKTHKNIGNDLRHGFVRIYEEDSVIDVTDYICKAYGYCYISVDENGYIYNQNADGIDVSVTSVNGKLCIAKYESKR